MLHHFLYVSLLFLVVTVIVWWYSLVASMEVVIRDGGKRLDYENGEPTTDVDFEALGNYFS
ncbi:hypothetical protein DGG96_01305 [Legionella qingyii]|uniref:Uncharacterized protein n=1 Tax=Legionella qingyii TaxID=2184757 RepID=A0A317U706_9GAMM|nr:hypothetical protein DGG96_01305 [Legionella qingyii]